MKEQYLRNTNILPCLLSKLSPQLSPHVWRNLSSVCVAVDEMPSKWSSHLPYKNRFTSTKQPTIFLNQLKTRTLIWVRPISNRQEVVRQHFLFFLLCTAQNMFWNCHTLHQTHSLPSNRPYRRSKHDMWVSN